MKYGKCAVISLRREKFCGGRSLQKYYYYYKATAETNLIVLVVCASQSKYKHSRYGGKLWYQLEHEVTADVKRDLKKL